MKLDVDEASFMYLIYVPSATVVQDVTSQAVTVTVKLFILQTSVYPVWLRHCFTWTFV